MAKIYSEARKVELTYEYVSRALVKSHVGQQMMKMTFPWISWAIDLKKSMNQNILKSATS